MTTTPVLAFLGWPEIVGILVIVLILFGAKRVPELMRGLGTGIKEFKKASREVQDELQRSIEEDPAHNNPPRQQTSAPAQQASSATAPATPGESSPASEPRKA